MKQLLDYKRVLLSLVILLTGIISAQERQFNEAETHYNRYEYIDAQQTYLKVAEKGYSSAPLFKNLGNSYYFNGQYKEASRWYKKLVSEYPEALVAEDYFHYAQTLKALELYQESDIYMAKFTDLNFEDRRSELFRLAPNYLDRIDFQSGRYSIEHLAMNSENTDFGSAFYGEFIVFSSSRDAFMFNKKVHKWNEEPFLDLYQAAYNPTNGELTEIEKLSKNLNSKYHESTPVFSEDGNTIYFTRNNYKGKRRKGVDKEGTTRLKIYRSFRSTKEEWSKPESLPFNNDAYSVAHPALSLDGKTLYFSSDMPGGQGQSDIYSVSINENKSFGTPENLGSKINTGGKETFPFVSKNNDLYFASNGHIGLGGLDVYVTRLNAKTREESLVVNVGKPINSSKDDFAFIVDDTTKRGYFSSNREGGLGKDDIYTFLQLQDLRSFCNIKIAGTVTDKDSGSPVGGSKLSILDNNNTLIEVLNTDNEGKYSSTTKDLSCSSEYFIRAEKPGYVTVEKILNTPDDTKTLNVSLILEKEVKSIGTEGGLAKGFSIKPIYFDFDRSNILRKSRAELARVIEIMNQYPQVKIDIRSHTDSYGNDNYNLKLSERRAKATMKYLILKGIEATRLRSKGYGETQPVNNCANGSNCTKEQYQLNRRSEFVLIN